MIRKILSATLFATALVAFSIAGLARVVLADKPPPPKDWFCDFYTVPNDPNTYCGGVCPLQTYVCWDVTDINTGVRQCYCVPPLQPVPPD